MDQLGRDLQLQPTASQVPLVDIVTYWMGDVAKDVFVVIVVFSIFALDVVGLAATGRLIFSFARDNIIPFSSALKKVNPQTQTPIRALATASGLGLVFVAWGYISAVTGKGNTAFLVLITATATLPFVVYFLTVLAYVLRRHRMDKLPEAFDLGAWAKPVMYGALAWTVIALGALMIPKDFWGADLIVVIVLAVAAAWYFAALRGRPCPRRGGRGAAEGLIALNDLEWICIARRALRIRLIQGQAQPPVHSQHLLPPLRQ